MRNNLLSLIFGLISLGSFAQFGSYQYASKIQQPNSTWHKIQLEQSVLGRAKDDLSDIRIFQVKGNDTTEAPYLLHGNEELVKEKIDRFTILNPVQKEGAFFYTLARKTSEEIREIKLNFDQGNFDWHIDLEGSDNGKDWYKLLSSYRIVSIKNEHTDFSYTKLVFPTTDYTRFRIKIKEKSDPGLSSASYFESKSYVPVVNKLKVSSFSTTTDATVKKTFVTTHFNLKTPLSTIRLKLNSDFDYYRDITIYGSRDSISETDPDPDETSILFSGSLNSFEAATFSFEQTFVKHVLIVIENNDNQALAISDLQAEYCPKSLTARFEKEGNYFLCYGKADADFPQYDIVYYKDKIPENLTALSYEIIRDDLEDSDPEQIKAEEAENPFWLWVSLSLIVVILLIFTLRMIRTKS